MPIYDYRCGGCGRKVSIYFRSIGAVEDNPACPECGARALTRRMSRVWARSGRAGTEERPEPSFEQDGVPYFGPTDDPYGGDDMSWGDEDDGDLTELARETREMAQLMGEPLDAEFDAALRHIERGADPDDVLGELEDATPEPSDSE
jgi:putative FmdB family regulatory protein